MLDRVLQSGSRRTCLDIGCGSGILAIAAGLLGHEVSAIDIDADALKNAHLNAQHNDMESAISFAVSGPASVTDVFDLVVANIIAPVLLENASAIKRCARRGLILSGLLAHQEPDIRAAYEPWVVKDRHSIGDWVILYLESD